MKFALRFWLINYGNNAQLQITPTRNLPPNHLTHGKSQQGTSDWCEDRHSTRLSCIVRIYEL